MCVLDLGASYLQGRAERAGRRRQQQIMDQMTAVQRAEFDRRMGYARDSDVRTGELLDRQNEDMGGLEDRTFAELLAENQAGFDTQLGLARTEFDTRNAADIGLTTENRRIRLEQAAISERERQRQLGFQADADARADALPGQIGYEAQRDAAASAGTARLAAASAAMSPANTPAAVAGMDPMLASLFASEAAKGQQASTADAAAAASFSGMGDAFRTSERTLGDFADGIASLTTRAQLSRGALGDELAVGGMERDHAQARRDFTAELAGRTANQRTSNESRYRDARTGAISGNANNLGNALQRFFGSMLDTEGTFTGNMVGSSQNYENTYTNLGNYRMGNTTAFSPLGNTLTTLSNHIKQTGSAMPFAFGGG